jgi:hypothetical protein
VEFFVAYMIHLASLWGLGTEEEEGYRTGPPGYKGWRNSFLGIDSGAPYTFKKYGLRTLTTVYIFPLAKTTLHIRQQCCETVMICCGSGSDFGNVFVLVAVPVLYPFNV